MTEEDLKKNTQTAMVDLGEKIANAALEGEWMSAVVIVRLKNGGITVLSAGVDPMTTIGMIDVAKDVVKMSTLRPQG